jgi:hypothetical protein
VGDRLFNAIRCTPSGAPDCRWSIDIVIDELVMSHRLELESAVDGVMALPISC